MLFAQDEAQFALASITIEKTKFNYVISRLEYRHAAQVEDISPQADEPYSTVKTELLRRPSSRDQRAQQFLTHKMGTANRPNSCAT
jgi:hypothetical protein